MFLSSYVTFFALRMSDIISRRQRAPWFWPDSVYKCFGEGREHEKTLKVVQSFTYKVSNGANSLEINVSLVSQVSQNKQVYAFSPNISFPLRWYAKEKRTFPTLNRTATLTTAQRKDKHFWTCCWRPHMRTAVRWAIRTFRRRWTPSCSRLVVGCTAFRSTSQNQQWIK